MEDTSSITKVQERLEKVQAALVAAKNRVLELEGQERRLVIALEVLQSLDDSGPSLAASGSQATAGTAMLSRLISGEVVPPDSSGLGLFGLSSTASLSSLLSLGSRKSTRQLILEQFMTGDTLTRVQVSERIKAVGQQANEQTIASTLSKLTADGILEKEGNAYRPKVAAPSADDTESGDDLA